MSEDINLRQDAARARICGKCGQPIDLQRESWSGTASGAEHKSCPTSLRQDAASLRQDAASASAVIRELPGASAYSSASGGAGRPQYITISQAAGMLSVSAKTIQRRIQAGELPAKHLRGSSGGGRGTILINQEDVLALLEDYHAAEDTP